MTEWVRDAVFYEIYPQSFRDANGDGIGDFRGIEEKLDYIKELGCNAIWMNPCYDSPFKDGGYDVRDYYRTASRYGTMEELKHLFEEVHRRGMHILLDLVPGHTSEEHPWFLESKKKEQNEFSGRYIWTNSWFQRAEGFAYIAGECERNGAYVLNYFKCQPALNYGFLQPKEAWQKPLEDPDCLATRAAICDVICFWLEAGCDGFRVDMADSLVKMDDEEKNGTCQVWSDILGRVRAKYPQAAFVSEWNNPASAINKAGFDMDFFLDWFGNGYHLLMRDYDENGRDDSFFKKESSRSICDFLEEYLPKYKAVGERGLYCLITGNHDMIRAAYHLEERELKLAYAFLLTMPGAPFIYYGDEIGMRYQELLGKEGGYTRTGSRTPMQWNDSRGMGFSEGDPETFYLPTDHAEGAPNVAEQERRADSLLSTVKMILAFRNKQPEFQDHQNLEFLFAQEKERSFAYRRGGLFFFCNPSGESFLFDDVGKLVNSGEEVEKVMEIGQSVQEMGTLCLAPQTFAVYRVSK